MKINIQLDQLINKHLFTDPSMVPFSADPTKESPEEINNRYERWVKLSRKIRFKLSSPETSRKIQEIGRKYGFELLRLANITRLIREYYFSEVSLEDFPKEIEKRMDVNLVTAQEITRHIKSEIIDWDPWTEYIANLPKRTVREIVEKYPKLADTEITAGYIERQDSDKLENPTIKNWIRNYISRLGYAKHTPMQRTQYLFHSENGKNLSSLDREKLGIILKSFDENIPLPIDEESGEIVFEGIIDYNEKENIKSFSDSFFSKKEKLQQNYLFAKKEEKEVKKKTAQNNFIKSHPRIEKNFSYRPADQLLNSTIRQETSISSKNQTYSQNSTASLPKNTFKAAPLHAVTLTDEQINVGHPPFSSTSPRSSSAKPNSSALNSEIKKTFTSESPDIPPIRIQSITEHNKPKIIPPNSDQSKITPTRPKHRIIDPFSRPKLEPRLDGNIVDLSGK